MNLFITLRFLDVLDILLVAFLLYQLFRVIKGTAAINIFVGIFLFYLLYVIVKSLDMELLGSIMGQFTGVGIIALIIVFQTEIRRFLLIIGTKYFKNKKFSLEKLFITENSNVQNHHIDSIVTACLNMSKTQTGALIVVSKFAELQTYCETGDIINAEINNRLIENIFFKNSPLHDGAMIIVGTKIKAARCVLPSTERNDLPPQLGMRHRAALGMAEETNALTIVVSEETGHISYTHHEALYENVGINRIKEMLRNEYLKS